MDTLTGDVGGVPYLVEPPPGGRADAPVVVAWHMLDAPRSESAFHAALPLAGLDAWKVYIGLPLSGSRLPDGGLEEFFARGARDAVRLGYDPVVTGGADEFGPAYATLCERFGFGSGPLGLVGASAGAAVACEVLARDEHDVVTVVLISPMLQMARVVAAVGEQFGVEYPWDHETVAIARRMDWVARVGDLPTMPLRVIVGDADDEPSILQPAMNLVGQFVGPANMVTVEGMGHALAAAPGLEPAPQTAHAAEVDELAVKWLRTTLVS